METAQTDPAFSLFQAATADALDCMETHRPDDARVHSARKALKRARAALRLLRPALSVETFERENRALRDAARFLSPLRDAMSLYAAVDLLEYGPGDVEGIGGALVILKKTLKKRLVQARNDFADGAMRRNCADLVSACRERFQHPATVNDETRLVGLRKIYRKARRTFARAGKERTPEALHEWRKQTKYLHTATSVLRSSGMDHLRKVMELTHEIADCLGDDHDLAQLRHEVDHLRVNDHESSALRAAIDERREKKERQAIATGSSVFRKKPRRFVESLSR
ncbi:MAG TPA: CHAD domain-containing protein [Rudaea sp.]|jgi:CHAD domain-containing protein